MGIEARFAHTNLIARDWRSLARFYEEVFGCVPLPPERDLEGDWLAAATGVPGAALRGVHLRLPGHGERGPTLEIFAYREPKPRAAPSPDEPGFGHVAFAVPDVEAALAEVLRAGGSRLGEVTETAIPGAGTICFVYARDPEGNVIELQAWS
jgi:catechol 2,3-dioxygenase-like lactoylglutathione lyase family enzyme